MKIINQFIAFLLLVWMGVFTQISTSHLGHGHDMLPSEDNICADNCENELHRSVGEACEWFMAKRLSENDDFNTTEILAPIEFDENQKWVAIYSLYTASDNNVYLVRGPPII